VGHARAGHLHRRSRRCRSSCRRSRVRPPASRRLSLRAVAGAAVLPSAHARLDQGLRHRALAGRPLVKNLVSAETWAGSASSSRRGRRAVLHRLPDPGLPKDLVCYLLASARCRCGVHARLGLGRIPGTWVLSAQGAHTAAGTGEPSGHRGGGRGGPAAYYYRHRLMAWFQAAR
jgi:hypothetical protein